MWDPVVSRIPRPGGFTKWGLPRSVDTGPRCRVGFALCVQFGQVTLRRETRVTAGVVVSVGHCLAVRFICKVAMRLLGLAKTGLRCRIGSASIDQFCLETLRWGARITAGAGAAVTACDALLGDFCLVTMVVAVKVKVQSRLCTLCPVWSGYPSPGGKGYCWCGGKCRSLPYRRIYFLGCDGAPGFGKNWSLVQNRL